MVELQKEINWDFKKAQTNLFTHSLHAYPARMVPGIAGELIKQYSKVGDLVVDPFCGSGTTLVEGTLAKRKIIGVDLNPFAVFMSKVKTTPIRPGRLERESKLLISDLHSSRARNRENQTYLEFPHIINLDFWYKRYVVRDLNFINARIDDFFGKDGDPIKDFFRLMLAKTAREVSNQRQREFKRWKMTQEDLSVFRPRPIKRFTENVLKALPSMKHYYVETNGKVHRKVVLGDARTFKTSRKASLIMTSPPYGDSGTTVAYGQYSSFALEWLKFTSKTDRRIDNLPPSDSYRKNQCLEDSSLLRNVYSEILDKDSQRAETVLEFFGGLNEVFTNFANVLLPGGKCCVVVGNRRVRGVEVPTDRIITELVSKVGYELRDKHTRTVLHKVIPFATKPWNSQGNSLLQKTIGNESILVFERI